MSNTTLFRARIDVQQSELLEAIKNALLCVGKDDFRPQMKHILFQLSNKYLTIVATDSYVLYEKKLALLEAPNLTGNLTVEQHRQIVIADDLANWVKFATKDKRDFAITSIVFNYSDTQDTVMIGDYTLSTFDGQFPPYESLLSDNANSNYDRYIEFNKSELAGFVKAADAMFRATGNNPTKGHVFNTCNIVFDEYIPSDNRPTIHTYYKLKAYIGDDEVNRLSYTIRANDMEVSTYPGYFGFSLYNLSRVLKLNMELLAQQNNDTIRLYYTLNALRPGSFQYRVLCDNETVLLMSKID